MHQGVEVVLEQGEIEPLPSQQGVLWICYALSLGAAAPCAEFALAVGSGFCGGSGCAFSGSDFGAGGPAPDPARAPAGSPVAGVEGVGGP